MKLKDIVNRDIVNLTNCDQEPIHIPGSIQPHGFLLGIHSETQLVTFCSGNAEAFTGHSFKTLIGSPASVLLSPEQMHEIMARASGSDFLNARSMVLHIGGRAFECHAHFSHHTLVLEAEPVLNDNAALNDIYAQATRFLHYMEDSYTLTQLCGLVAQGIRDITGYDRVMIYRFDAQYNGEVIAESKRDDLEPFLGLHYPHTDIPPQARALYLKNLIRIIADVNYTPVPLYTADNGENTGLDLSLSVLRSVSPIHVQYLHNMGVGATLTISLVYRGRLWGLVACHHYSVKYLSHDLRLAAKLQGLFITSQISVRQQTEELQYSVAANKALETLSQRKTATHYDAFDELVRVPEMLSICNASAAAIIVEGRVYKSSKNIDDNVWLEVAAFCGRTGKQGHFSTNNLAGRFPAAEGLCASIAGVNYHSLNYREDCIIWVRPETITEVSWAGDPQKAIVKDAKGLSPRRSFDLWKETVKCMSLPWRASETDACAAYADILQKQVNFIKVTEEERIQRQLSESLKEINSELENINWISTHDLQEPLRKIQVSASRIIESANPSMEEILHFVHRMNESAGRMQTLLGDVLEYNRIRDNKKELLPVDLQALVQQVAADLNEPGSAAVLDIRGLPVVQGTGLFLRQLFVNILQNAFKFAHAHRPLHVKISSESNIALPNTDPLRFYRVRVADNGIGFDPQYNEKVFEVFARLNHQSEYPGSGIGLALCRRIMKNHNGFIFASGERDKGLVLDLYFPMPQSTGA